MTTSSEFCSRHGPAEAGELIDTIEWPSGARVRLTVRLAQPVGRDVGVDLGGRRIIKKKQLLDGAQIRSTLEQMGGGGVPQAVRTEVRRTRDVGETCVHQRAYRPLVDTSATAP